MGTKVGNEFRVNTNYTNNQVAPAVAMDSYGNFVVVWATKGQSFSYFNDIHGQIYDQDGTRMGSEFRVNSMDLAGTTTRVAGDIFAPPSANEVHPAVAMSDGLTPDLSDDNIVFTWDAVTAQTNGIVMDSVIMARRFNGAGLVQPLLGDTMEVQVSMGNPFFAADASAAPQMPTAGGGPYIREARNAQVAMDGAGNFTIVWEAFQDNDFFATTPDSYGIYFRRFNADGTPDNNMEMAEHQANMVVNGLGGITPFSSLFAYDQVNPTIAVDYNGDYKVAWDGNGAAPDALDPTNYALVSDIDSQGVFIRSFRPGNSQSHTQITPESEFIGPQTRVNITSEGNQKFPSLAMTPDGDSVVVWTGTGVGDQNGIFFRRYDEPTDTVGPLLTNFLLPDSTPIPLTGTTQVMRPLYSVVVTFDEDMFHDLTNKGSDVTNPANYQLLQNGVAVSGGISRVYYGLDIANQLGSTSEGDGLGLNSFPKLNKYRGRLGR